MQREARRGRRARSRARASKRAREERDVKVMPRRAKRTCGVVGERAYALRARKCRGARGGVPSGFRSSSIPRHEKKRTAVLLCSAYASTHAAPAAALAGPLPGRLRWENRCTPVRPPRRPSGSPGTRGWTMRVSTTPRKSQGRGRTGCDDESVKKRRNVSPFGARLSRMRFDYRAFAAFKTSSLDYARDALAHPLSPPR